MSAGEWKPLKKKMSKKAKRNLILVIIAAAAAAVIAFWALFYITDVEVIGNTRYTKEEVREMALPGFLDHNSFFVSTFRGRIMLEDIPFMEYVDVEFLDRNSVRLHVTEKYPIGYIRKDGLDYYFDKDGVVLEILSEQQDSSNAGDAGPFRQTEITEKFHAALTDVPRIEGLVFDQAQEGEPISASMKEVFNTLLALDRMLSKYDIQPDYVSFDEQYNITLHYGEISVELGAGAQLEDKMARVAGILPELQAENLAGTLHLEDLGDETVNIIFDRK